MWDIRYIHEMIPFWAFFSSPTLLSISKHCYPPGNEILINMGIKCYNLTLHAQCLKIFITTIHTVPTLIGCKQCKVKLKFGVNMSFSSHPCSMFHWFKKNSTSIVVFSLLYGYLYSQWNFARIKGTLEIWLLWRLFLQYFW